MWSAERHLPWPTIVQSSSGLNTRSGKRLKGFVLLIICSGRLSPVSSPSSRATAWPKLPPVSMKSCAISLLMSVTKTPQPPSSSAFAPTASAAK
eukprot:5881635-Pyramimonas_sp.AAC.1